MTLTVGSLCTGTGAMELGLAQVLDVEPLWFADPDPGAAALLAHRYPSVPNLGDLTAVDWRAIRRPDIVTTGFPCTDISAAGRQAGMRVGNRSGLWFPIVDVIAELQPQLVIIENVRAILHADADSNVERCPWCVGDGPRSGLRALGAVLGDLADLGFDAEWCVVPASGVGACHQRERVVVVAAPATDPEGVGRGEGRPEPIGEGQTGAVCDRGGAAADPDGGGLPEWAERDGEPVEPGLETSLGDDFERCVLDWAAYQPAIERWERVLGRAATAPTVLGARGARRLNPAFVEWMQGVPEGWVTEVPRITRNQMIKLLGNAPVPHQITAALVHLLPLLLAERVAA
jgi:DNA (cytosine-5)-methyltransferase 1